jgi:cell division protein FtsZ
MRQTRISIVGAGGAGCKVIDRLAAAPDEGTTLIAVNTDARSLEGSRAMVKLQIGSARTQGLGCGGDPATGRLAAEEDIEMIRSLFPNVDLVLLVVGLGGGTGTGASPILLNAARDAGAMTLCFATLPFRFEGGRRRAEADQAVSELRTLADALILVPNDRLSESVGEAQVAKAFDKADEVLCAGISSVCKLLTAPGYISLDFADLKQVATGSGGVCTFGYGMGSGKNKAETAVAALLENPLLERGSVLASSGALLVSIVGSSDLTLKDVTVIMNRITAKAGRDDHVLMGTVLDETWQDRVGVTVVAAETPAGRPAAAPDEPTPEPAPSEPAAAGGRKKRKQAPLQTRMRLFDSAGKGKFKDVEPTILDGQDLDTPTFMRRGIAIEK